MQPALTALGNAWKKLLALPDSTLGIDAEFTRPGIEALLGKLADTIEGTEDIECKLVWK